jgi:Asp-tRNA(Asn)/Glu-tRNA(Gln) amidotransferase A subunit family amidase
MAHDLPLSRKELLTATLASLAATGMARSPGDPQGNAVPPADITLDDLKAVERIAGLEFTDEERKAALAEIRSARAGFLKLRETPVAFTTDPMTVFTPLGGGSRPGPVRVKTSPTRLRRPLAESDLAFLNLRQLGHLLRTRQVTSYELTRLYLDRLKRHGDRLLCVVTLTEDLALRQAERADRELRDGKDRGPLHGIPYGIKDLFATNGIPTTWGADPYKTQVFDFDATVVRRLEQAGAVLLAKLSMGALAMGDVWFRGTTKNPWNEAQGSSGSSAGSAAALAAGLVPFAIGTETYGSITSPSLRCRVTGFRPTYGRVSRYGAMELSYTMDKVGPICRDAEDCALVFAAICGADPHDPSAVDRPFAYPRRVDFRKLKIGYLGGEDALGKDPAALALREMGATVLPKSFTPVPNGLFAILEVESSSSFEELTRSGRIRELKNSTWPESFRGARYVPAVEYLQAQRHRTVAMRRFEDEFGDLDLLLGQGLGSTLAHTNFGGHPQVLLPWGDDGKGNSVGRSLVGRLYRDDELLAVAKALQDRFDYHRRRPEGF